MSRLEPYAVEPTPQLIDAMFWERVRRAREMPPEEKLLAGAQLFDFSTKIMADGIRSEMPRADENRVHQILLERLALARRLEQTR